MLLLSVDLTRLRVPIKLLLLLLLLLQNNIFLIILILVRQTTNMLLLDVVIVMLYNHDVTPIVIGTGQIISGHSVIVIIIDICVRNGSSIPSTIIALYTT